MCECFARCEADCVCDHDWTPPELTAARETIAALEAERDQLRDVLWRGGFVMCDIPACNCGSWHHKYGLPERFREIVDVLAEAGHELCNENGNLPIRALKSLAAERDQLLARIEDTDSACADYAFAGAHTAREIIEKLHDRIRGYKGDLDQLRAELVELRDKLKVCSPLLDEVGLDEEFAAVSGFLSKIGKGFTPPSRAQGRTTMEMLEMAAELKWCRERIAALEAECDRLDAYRIAEHARLIAELSDERDQLLATPADKREDLHCVIADISAKCASLCAERDQLRAELAECKRDVEIVRFLRCGGWEVLQNPKYWTLENKFYGAIAEAMAEVTAEGDKNGNA